MERKEGRGVVDSVEREVVDAAVEGGRDVRGGGGAVVAELAAGMSAGLGS